MAGGVHLSSGKTLRTKGLQDIPEGERLLLQLPGGGGMGAAWTRDPALVARDVRDGLVSMAQARAAYRVATDAAGALDLAETHALREG
jgi:N-methylhydantoinase B